MKAIILICYLSQVAGYNAPMLEKKKRIFKENMTMQQCLSVWMESVFSLTLIFQNREKLPNLSYFCSMKINKTHFKFKVT